MTNPVSGGFQFTPTQGLNDTVAYPTTPVSETAARQQVMDLYWQLMNEMNSPTLSAAAYHSMSRQALINGNFDRWLRGSIISNPSSGTYTADRFKLSATADGGIFPNLIHSQQTLTPGDLLNSYNYYRINSDGTGSSFGVNMTYRITQNIELGTRFLCGAGKKITLSFYAKSSIANKKLGIGFAQNYGSGGSPTSEEIIVGNKVALTSNWTKYTVTINTNTLVGKNFGTNNDDSFKVYFYAAWGSNIAVNVGDTVAEGWNSAGNVDIAQVQVNAGDTGLAFQQKDIALIESECQRYNIRLGGSAYTVFGVGVAVSSTQAYIFIPLPKKMRVIPTLTNSGAFRIFISSGIDVTGFILDTTLCTTDRYTLIANVSTGLTAGQAVVLEAKNDATAYLNFDSEL